MFASGWGALKHKKNKSTNNYAQIKGPFLWLSEKNAK